MLAALNDMRDTHASPPLAWDTQLAAAAQAYAVVLAGQRCDMVHAPYRGDGETLYNRSQSSAPDAGCTRAVRAWYSEVRYYKWGAADLYRTNWALGTGHFTQLVWRSTASVGCGQAGGVDGPLSRCQIVVCRFRGPGNLPSDAYFRANVLPPVVPFPPFPPTLLGIIGG